MPASACNITSASGAFGGVAARPATIPLLQPLAAILLGPVPFWSSALQDAEAIQTWGGLERASPSWAVTKLAKIRTIVI